MKKNRLGDSFYKDIMSLFGLKIILQDYLLHIMNKNLKNNYEYTCDNKQMISVEDSRYMPYDYSEKQIIPFHPLSSLKESCSHLLIDDSIHLYLKNLTFTIFEKIITTKDGTISKETNEFDTTQLNKLLNPNKNTKYKFYNLFNIVSATSFSKNLISFEIDFTNSPQNTKVNFKYPLYDMLNNVQNNTIFGIHLEDNEIMLFKQIYETYIITTIDNLFQEPINILKQSNQHPKFYILATIKLILEETYWKKHNIYFISSFKKKIKKYKDMLSDLNHYNQYAESIYFKDIYMTRDQELDQEAYKNEIQIRRASEPNWLYLKDSIMEENLNNNKKGIMISAASDKIKTLEKTLELSYEKYYRKINTFLVNESVNSFVQNYQIYKNNQEWSEIFYWQELVLDILYSNGGSLWFDTRINQYAFRSKGGGSIVYENKDKISELLTRALKEDITNFLHNQRSNFFSNYALEIVLVHKLKNIRNQRLGIGEQASSVIKILLFENEIITIDDDEFNILQPDEFIRQTNELLYTRNRFIPTKYLMKRFNPPYYPSPLIKNTNLFLINKKSYLYEKNKHYSKSVLKSKQLSFIEQFIFYLVNEDYHTYYYVMNWLVVFFNSLQKSGTALVLLGDEEVTQNIFWDKIIKEIFGRQYCITINDKNCNTDLSFDITYDKLFFHIGDISNAETKFDDRTLSKIVKDILVKPTIFKENDNNEIEKTIVHGQMIITAKNPLPYIKKALSKCTIIKVNDMDTIIEKLEIPDEAILEDKIQQDLDNFTDILCTYCGDDEIAKYAMNTEDRNDVINNKSSNIDSEDIDKEIDSFIQAIKTKDIDYFEKVKNVEDGTIYEHLKNAFSQDKGYFIGQYLFDCYNSIYPNQPFEKKKLFMDKLKGKDDIFQQEVKTLKILDKNGYEEVLFQSYSTSKETGNKELYKIKDYVLASNIIIPNESTILSSQENIKKFAFTSDEEMDKCLKRTKEYRAKKP